MTAERTRVVIVRRLRALLSLSPRRRLYICVLAHSSSILSSFSVSFSPSCVSSVRCSPRPLSLSVFVALSPINHSHKSPSLSFFIVRKRRRASSRRTCARSLHSLQPRLAHLTSPHRTARSVPLLASPHLTSPHHTAPHSTPCPTSPH